MKTIHVIALLLLLGCTRSNQRAQFFTYQNPIAEGIDPKGLRDCQVLRDGDWWYLTGTSYPFWPREEVNGKLNPGVALYRSKDLKKWTFVKYIIEPGAANQWYRRRFWAPEIHKFGKKYYTTFNCSNPESGYPGQHIGYAVADQIEGPYQIITEQKPLSNGNDLSLFEDSDGKTWAFWNRGREFGIVYAQLDLEQGRFLTEPKTAILAAKVDFAYDNQGEIMKEPGYDGRPIPKVAKYYDWDAIGIEGAYVIKRKGLYYLFYSSWTRGYEIGYATAKILNGPWTKAANNPFCGAQNPVTCSKNGLPFTGNPDLPFNQVGHNEIFRGPDGRFWLSCHGIQADGVPKLVIDPIWFDADGQVHSSGPSFTQQTIKLK